MNNSVGLFGAWEHAKSVITLSLLLGVILYQLDRTIGVRVYRFLYNLCHSKDKQMPEDVRVGFLYEQSSRRMIFVVSVIEVWYIAKLISTYGVLGLDYFSELFVWFALPFALPIGYYLLGRLVFSLLSKVNPFIHQVDEINREGVDIDGMTRQVRSISSAIFGFASRFTARTSPVVAAPKPAPIDAPPASQAKAEDPDDVIARYTKGR